jgi:hypothetical protein
VAQTIVVCRLCFLELRSCLQHRPQNTMACATSSPINEDLVVQAIVFCGV